MYGAAHTLIVFDHVKMTRLAESSSHSLAASSGYASSVA